MSRNFIKENIQMANRYMKKMFCITYHHKNANQNDVMPKRLEQIK